MRDKLKAKGTVKFVLTDKNGNVKLDKTVKNLVVNTGLDFVCDRMLAAPTLGNMSHIAVGTSPVAAAAGDTTLGVQLGTRVGMDTAGGVNNADSTITFTSTFGSGVSTWSGGLVEAGIFNASTAGTMLCRTTFNVINKGDDDTLSITWTIDFNAV